MYIPFHHKVLLVEAGFLSKMHISFENQFHENPETTKTINHRLFVSIFFFKSQMDLNIENCVALKLIKNWSIVVGNVGKSKMPSFLLQVLQDFPRKIIDFFYHLWLVPCSLPCVCYPQGEAAEVITIPWKCSSKLELMLRVAKALVADGAWRALFCPLLYCLPWLVLVMFPS